MTTSVKIIVNGRYVATVTQTVQTDEFTIVKTMSKVHGRYDGSPNPSGGKVFWLTHPAQASFEVSEEQVAP